MRALLRQMRPAAVALLIFTLVTGVAYPLLVTAIGQTAFNNRADGSLLYDADGDLVGSRLLGQQFVSDKYFWPRPSAAGAGYDAMASSGSNLGPTNATYLATVEQRAVEYRRANQLAESVKVPVDAVTSSGSGLDPHISVANARLQADRVAAARGLGTDVVFDVIDQHTNGRAFGILGEPGVNVLTLNIQLDRLTPSGK